MKLVALGQTRATEQTTKVQRDKLAQTMTSVDDTVASRDDYTQKVVTATPQTAQEMPLQTDKELLKKTAERVNREPAIIDKKLRFKFHDGTGKLFVEVTDNNNGKVLAEIPPKTLLDLEARLKVKDAPPLLVNSKV